MQMEDEEGFFEALPEEILIAIVRYLLPRDLWALGQLSTSLRRIAVESSHTRGRLWARWRFLQRSMDYFRVCLMLDKNHASTYDERAIARFNMGDRWGALQDLTKSVELAPDEVSRLVLQSIKLEMSGEVSNSLIHSRKAIELCPTDARPYFEVAYVLQELPFDPDFVGSAVAYTKALELGYHREYVAIFNRGWSREESGDIQGALSDYLHTLELNPFFQQAARSVARLRAKAEDRAAILQDIAECEHKLEHLLAIGETPAIRSHLYVQMGYNYDALRENEKALDCYGKAIEHEFPRAATLHICIGSVHERMGNMDAAIKSYDDATDCDGFFIYGLENKARLLARLGRHVEALDLWATVKGRDPIAINPYHQRARVFVDAGEPVVAMRELRSALEVNPRAECVDTRFMLGEILAKQNLFEESQECYRAVLGFYPNAALPLILLAHLCIRLGNLSEAEELLTKAVAHRPSDLIAANNLGCVLFTLGKFERAAQVLADSLTVTQGDYRLRMNCVAACIKCGRVDEAVRSLEGMRALWPSSGLELMLNMALNEPEEFSRILDAKRLMWKRQYAFEGWMVDPTAFVVASREYYNFEVEHQRREEEKGDDDDDGEDGDGDDDSDE